MKLKSLFVIILGLGHRGHAFRDGPPAAVFVVVEVFLSRRLLTSTPAVILVTGPFLLVADLVLAPAERPGKERAVDSSLPGGLPIN